MPPVVAAVGAGISAVSAFAASSAIAGFVVNLGASLLLSAAANALMPKPKLAAQSAAQLSPRTVTIREPVVPRDIVYGRVQKGGVIVFLHSTGETQNILHLVIVLATHQVQSIGAVYFDGALAISADGFAQGRWAGRVGIEKRVGNFAQTAFGVLQRDTVDKWTPDHRLDGCAAIYLQMQYDQDAFPTGIPNIKVDIEGKNTILDPRTGTTGYTENAALCLADYLSQSPFGPGLSYGGEDGINIPSLIEAANICDELVPVPGGAERRYTCNGVVSTAETPQTIIEAMLTASAGHVVWQGGDWHVRAGAYRIPTETLTANDIRDEGFTVQTRNSRATNFNGVRGKFISPENDWQPDDFPAFASDVYLAEDSGERKWRDISLPFTITASAAQRLAKIELEKARRQISVQAPCKLSAWKTAVGDTVKLNYARWGFVEKPVFVSKLTLSLRGSGDGARLLPEVELQETSPLVYDWSASEAQIYAAAPRTALPSAFDVPVPGVPVLSESLYLTRDGTSVRAQIRADWSAAPSGFVASYQVQARRRLGMAGVATGAEWIDLGQTNQTFFEIRDIQPGTWDVRVRSVSSLGVRSDWAQATIEASGLAAPPVAVEGLHLQSAGGMALLTWQPHPDLDVEYGGLISIRHSASPAPVWENTTNGWRTFGRNTSMMVPLMPGTYFVAALDAQGNRGPVTAISTDGIQAIGFINAGFLQEDDEFTGAVDGTIADTGALYLTTAQSFDDLTDAEADGVDWDPALVVTEGTYSFATVLDLAAPKRVRLRPEVVMEVVNVQDDFDASPGDVDEAEDWDGTTGAECDVIVEVQTTLFDPALGVGFTDWSAVYSTEVAARGIRARARLKSNSTVFTPQVTTLRLYADEVG